MSKLLASSATTALLFALALPLPAHAGQRQQSGVQNADQYQFSSQQRVRQQSPSDEQASVRRDSEPRAVRQVDAYRRGYDPAWRKDAPLARGAVHAEFRASARHPSARRTERRAVRQVDAYRRGYDPAWRKGALYHDPFYAAATLPLLPFVTAGAAVNAFAPADPFYAQAPREPVVRAMY